MPDPSAPGEPADRPGGPGPGPEWSVRLPPPDGPEPLPHLEPLPTAEVAAVRDRLLGRVLAEVPAADLPEPRRVIHPGEMYTMEFLPRRINLFLDGEGRIREVTAG